MAARNDDGPQPIANDPPEMVEKSAPADEEVARDNASSFAQDMGYIPDGKVTFQQIMAVVALCAVYNAYLFTLLMPGIILTSINAEVGPSSSYPWIAVVWNLCAASIVTVGGRITDIFGRRWFLIFGAILGALGSLIGALGRSVPQMIAAGVIMGCGGGFQEIIFACVQEVVPNRRRLLALGCLEVSNVIGMFSPLISTAYNLYSPIKWRACYWHMFACECAAVVALYFWYKPPSFKTKHRDDGKSKWELFKELDYVGLCLFVAGCVLILMALNWGGRDYPWNSAGVIAPLVVAGFTFVALVCWEVYYPLKYPILPPQMFTQSPQFCVIVLVVFLNGMLYYSSNVLWPRQAALLFTPKDNPILAGVYANIFSFGTIASFWVVLFVVPNVGYERWQIVIFESIQVALIGAMSSVGQGDTAKAIAMIMIISMTVAPINFLCFGMASLALADQRDIGASQGILSTARLIGGAIATAVYLAIQQTKASQALPGRVIEFAQRAGFNGDNDALVRAAANNTAAAYRLVPGMNNQTIAAAQVGVVEANADSFKLVYLVAIAFGGVMLLVSLTLKNIPKSKKTTERAVHLENEKLQDLVPASKVVG